MFSSEQTPKTVILRVRYSKLSEKKHPSNFRFVGYDKDKSPLQAKLGKGASVPCSLLTTNSGGDLRSPDEFAPDLVVEGYKERKPSVLGDYADKYVCTRNMNTSYNNKKTKKNKCVISLSEKSKMWNIYDGDKNILSTIYEKGVSDEIEITPNVSPLPNENIQKSGQRASVPCSLQTTNLGGDRRSPDKFGQPDVLPKNTTFHRCQSCDHILMIMEDGFPTCTNTKCCIMYKDILDYSPEWRFYGANDKNATDPTRCGNPINPLLVESSFGCKILCGNRSSYEMKKIRKWTEWQSTPHREKSLYEEFQFITIMAQNAGIPKIFIDYAMVIHKDISEQKMFRGMNRDGIKAASIYISCRLNECPRTAHEIADIFKLDKQSTTYGCSMAVNILHNIERNIDPAQKTELGTTTPSAFIDRYCSRLNIMNELAILSKFIAKKVENHSIVCDNTPQSSAAGIVYFVSQICKLDISKLDIKVICGVSEVTINKCYKKLDSIRHQLVPQCILDKYM